MDPALFNNPGRGEAVEGDRSWDYVLLRTHFGSI